MYQLKPAKSSTARGSQISGDNSLPNYKRSLSSISLNAPEHKELIPSSQYRHLKIRS